MKHISHIKSIVRGIGIFTILSLVASFCNFLFNFILIRLLTPFEFRDLTLANNIINVFGNLFIALNVVSIAVFYIAKDRQADIIRACQKVIYLVYALLLVLCIIFNSQVQERTGMQDAILLNLTIAVIFFSIPVMVLNAIYLGAGRFNKSAVLNICLAAGRLAFGVLGALLIANHKDVAAVGGILIVFIIVFASFTIFEKEQYRKQNLDIFKRIWEAPIHILKQHRKLVITSVLYAVTINFLFGLDLFIFGQFFTDDQSADYAAISVVGKLVFYIVAPISIYLAAKQQEFIRTRPKAALRVSAAVNTLTMAGSVIIALVPLSVIGLIIHRSTAEINHSYLYLSLLFNTMVTLANYQVIEAIIGKQQKTAFFVLVALLGINGGLFLLFPDVSSALRMDPAVLALGIPALTMAVGSIILFFMTHFRQRSHQAETHRN